MSDTSRVLDDVKDERTHQQGRWNAVHDDEHTTGEWADLIEQRTVVIASAFQTNHGAGFLRHQFIEAAAIAVAAVESLDRQGVR